MNFDKYKQFGLQDFLADDDFIQSVINPGTETAALWHSFKDANPQQGSVMEQASTIILQYRRQDEFYNEEHKELLWKRIENSIAKQPATRATGKIVNLKGLLRVAAAIIIVAGVAVWLYMRNTQPGQMAYTTSFGEVKTITLPDNSQVTLNGNSSITWTSSWNKNTTREVWIKGEGYFKVMHLNADSTQVKPHERFIVHCGDVNIEVLGTTFNVKARHGKTNVALITGKIRIDYTDPSSGNKTVYLAPGDYVEYAAKKLLTTKKLTKPAQVTGWTVKEISFSDATLREIAETLQDSYGYTVSVKDSSLLSLKIEGDISVSNVPDLLDVVATTLDIKIDQPGGKNITITK